MRDGTPTLEEVIQVIADKGPMTRFDVYQVFAAASQPNVWATNAGMQLLDQTVTNLVNQAVEEGKVTEFFKQQTTDGRPAGQRWFQVVKRVHTKTVEDR